MEIFNLKMVNKGSVESTLSVKIPAWANFMIHEIAVFKRADGGRWINFPSRTYEKEGKKQYFQFNGFADKETKQAFERKLFEVYDKFIAENPQEMPTQPDLFGEGVPF